jgi:hypothetical protein
LSAPSGNPAAAASSATRSSVLGRLDDAGVAGGQRAADAATEDLQRVVPRDDVAGDAVRLAPGQHRVALGVRQRFAVELVAGPSVELEVAGAGDDVGARLRHRLAAVPRLEPRQLVAVVGDRARQGGELAPLLGRRAASPRTVEGGPRRTHRGVDVGRTAACDRGERLAVGRIEHRQRLAAHRRDKAPADEVLRRRADRVHGAACRRSAGGGGGRRRGDGGAGERRRGFARRHFFGANLCASVVSSTRAW